MKINELKKDSLNIFETVALSVAIMGPSASIAIIVGMMAFYTNYSAPLVFAGSMLIVGFVSISIVKLNQYFPSSGSVYYFVEKTLGTRAGFVSGWLIVFAYLMLGVSCAAVASSYLQSLLGAFGLNINWEIIAAILLALVWYLAFKDAKTSTGMMLILEVASMGLILVLSIIIIIRTATSTGLSIVPFKLGGNSISSFSSAAVFGFLAFSGFEGASSLGEESKNPQKTIPIAILCAVIISGLFYIVVSYAQVLGFGITLDGMKALADSQAPLGDLTSRYLGSGVSIAILLCITVSFFSSTLGCVSAGARILFTMSRDNMLSHALARAHKIHNTPLVGINILIGITALILMSSFRLPALHVGGYAAMTGTLALLLSYIITVVGAIVYFHRNKIWKGVKLVIPIISVLALALIFYANVYPVPEYPMNLFPYIVVAWLAIGVFLGKRKTTHPSLPMSKD